MPENEIRIGCAGWSIPKEHAANFEDEGSHLVRYAGRFPAVEINSCFYRPHRPSTYARWASETPDDFAFALKFPREITHDRRLVDVEEPLDRFLAETSALGAKRGPLLVQLPPSLAFDARRVGAFFTKLLQRHGGLVACEPRHTSWFKPEADDLLREFQVARVAADPAVTKRAAEPGGWAGLGYYRLHGSPQMYYSAYSAGSLDVLAETLARDALTTSVWCIFDNTALGAATADALGLMDRLAAKHV